MNKRQIFKELKEEAKQKNIIMQVLQRKKVFFFESKVQLVNEMVHKQ